MDMTATGRAISDARKKSGLTQEELAGRIGVSPQAVSKWENGHNLPDIENMMRIAEITNVPYSALLAGDGAEEQTPLSPPRTRLFQEGNMFTRIRTASYSEGLKETYRAVQYMREKHAGQFRNKSRFSEERVLYINHPLVMACQGHALGIRDDALLAAILLHDVVEDTGVALGDLPFSPEVREIVGLVTFSVPEGKTKEEAKDEYYGRIRRNGKACVVKIIDRCSNVSTMAASYQIKRMLRYIDETENRILPLCDELKHNYPEYSDLAFLVKYQIMSIIETIKCMI